MPLTDIKIKSAKPQEKQYKISDERGLYLLVTKSGKYFRFDYRFEGKRKTLSFGVYPDVSLKLARERRDEARSHVANGIDPGELKKLKKIQIKEKHENNFEAVACEWASGQIGKWSERHKVKVLNRLKRDIFPVIGSKPINEISAPEILTALRRIEARGAIDCAHRAKQNCSQVFRYAIACGKADRDPAADLKGALKPTVRNNFSSILEPEKVGELLRAIDSYSGSYIVKYALQLAPLLFVRPGELRQAEWQEVDISRGEWIIPAAKMKMRRPHIVPLARQSIAVLKQLIDYSGHTKYLFPSMRTDLRPMSDNAINAALRRMGYSKEEMTGHGFRATASTLLHGLGWKSDVIERQLAHMDTNLVKAAYNHAQYLPERKEMMQFWADYLDELREP